MTILGLCFNGAVHGMAGHHDPLLVIASYIIAVFASYTALELAERLRASRGIGRALWHIAAAVVLGGGVWSMHFVAILAYDFPFHESYDPFLTILSGLVAIGAVAVGLQIIREIPSWRRIGVAGLLVGLGNATMHYAGMEALRIPGQIYYKPGLFVLSVVIAIVAATAALWLASVLRLAWQRGLAALVMALAVCGMHYTGMAATEIVAGPANSHIVGGAMDADALAALVGSGVSILLIVGLACTFIDRHLERRRIERRLREAIDVMPAALGFYDADDRLVAWNTAYAGLFEDPATLRPGARFVDLLSGPMGEADLAGLMVIRSQLGVVERQFPDGRWMRIESRRTADGGVVSIGADISALKAQAEALEGALHAAEAASLAKSEFLATMGHELRTPLNGVLGMVQTFAGDALTDSQRQRVDVIRQSSESLLAILSDLIDLTQIETGASCEEDEFDIDELLRGVVGAHRLAAEAKGLALSCQVAGRAQGRYSGDSARIRRIVYNLLDNAVKFTDRGAVRLMIDAADGEVRFEVTDTGPGMGEEDLKRIFEPFFQVDATLTRRHGGAGIGLAVCFRLAHMLGGRIEATSRLGEGSAFGLELPLVRLEVAPAATVDESPEPPADALLEAAPAATVDESLEPPADALRVLAAEDNPVNQMVLRALLGAVDIEPVIVDDGRAAVAAWAAQTWDIVLMDIQMPIMNGIDATRAIRAREAQEGRARIPIIAVTANAMAHEAREYRAAGMDDVVAKPVELAALLAAIERALEAGEAAQVA